MEAAWYFVLVPVFQLNRNPLLLLFPANVKLCQKLIFLFTNGKCASIPPSNERTKHPSSTPDPERRSQLKVDFQPSKYSVIAVECFQLGMAVPRHMFREVLQSEDNKQNRPRFSSHSHDDREVEVFAR
jgi:hypothetical protein